MAFTSSRLAFWNETKESFRKQGPVKHSKSLIHAIMRWEDQAFCLAIFQQPPPTQSWRIIEFLAKFLEFCVLILEFFLKISLIFTLTC